uniref:uncharacterized protein si:dkey-33c12.4 isoform X2 n=2 Tax=Doryrhamphus excisus TaxID=161450 RepID=UPI0025AE3F66|nr:uncharacterized protein si:dkey-33c12.4 isoform X2 [Doryrhamphus excisus]
MPRRRGVVKSRPPRLTYGEKQPAIRSQNSVFDMTSGPSAASFLDALTFRFMGLHFFRSFDSTLDSDMNSDSDDDYDEDEEERLHLHSVGRHPLEPHPRIRQLTDEEAEKHAKQAAEEQQQHQSKTERNKRKKLRKKEKKRLEKESRNISAEADGDEPQEAMHLIGAQAQESLPKAKKENKVTLTNDGSDEQEEEATEMAADEEAQQEEEGVNLDISGEVVSDENSSKSTETPDAPMETPHSPKKEDKELKRTDPIADDYIQKSAKLAEFGIHWAAAGRHAMAVRCFTEAIKLNPKERKLFGNRSFCYEKMHQYDKALSDAEVALLMEPKWIKGLFRKAKALCGLKRYNQASLVYAEVLNLDGSCREAMQELNQMQISQLMEMGFTQEESMEALQSHSTLEAAVDALFNGASHPPPGEATEEGEWIVQQASKPRTQHAKELGNKWKTQPLTKKSVKWEVFQIWVGCLSPTVTYAMLYELFNSVGAVYKVKMLLDQQSAFVNYAREEDCVEAIQRFHGMKLHGSTLVVRFPMKTNTEPRMSTLELSDPAPHCSRSKRECFFWRTTGCERQDCTFRHVPEHESIDKDRVTSGFGTTHMQT